MLRAFILSTPHGTLGTSSFVGTAFKDLNLSTPHGTLGTRSYILCNITDTWGLSTPHGTLGTPEPAFRVIAPAELSTPHGTLGTPQTPLTTRNPRSFQLHTVH